MASLPRILTVDSTNQIAGIMRGAMLLMDRRFILVEVPTAEDALSELHNTHTDLLVTAYRLPDSNGIDLASRAIRDSASTPVIVLSSPDDNADVDEEKLASAPYTYLVRPVGEQFLRALRIGLDGEAAVVAQESSVSATTGPELGNVPEVDEARLHNSLMSMMRDTGAMGAFVADRLGRVILSQGVTGYFDIEVCAAILSPHFTHTVDVRELIGGHAWSLQYFDGDNYDIFALSLGLHYFAALIFDGTKRAPFGPVTQYARKEADTVAEAMGDEAWSYRRQVSTITQTAAVVTPEMLTEDDHNDRAEVQPVVEEISEPVAESEPALSPPPEIILDPIEDFDPNALFDQQVDENAFDDLFSEEELSHDFLGGTANVSFDEALNMGILDE
ncbi:MAG TPA: response regulator [Aggregatilineales bacterium]|nr:response regulator [Aggregatilineales bacterium]